MDYKPSQTWAVEVQGMLSSTKHLGGRRLAHGGDSSLRTAARKMTGKEKAATSQISIISNYLLIAPLGFGDLALEILLKVQ